MRSLTKVRAVLLILAALVMGVRFSQAQESSPLASYRKLPCVRIDTGEDGLSTCQTGSEKAGNARYQLIEDLGVATAYRIPLQCVDPLTRLKAKGQLTGEFECRFQFNHRGRKTTNSLGSVILTRDGVAPEVFSDLLRLEAPKLLDPDLVRVDACALARAAAGPDGSAKATLLRIQGRYLAVSIDPKIDRQYAIPWNCQLEFVGTADQVEKLVRDPNNENLRSRIACNRKSKLVFGERPGCSNILFGGTEVRCIGRESNGQREEAFEAKATFRSIESAAEQRCSDTNALSAPIRRNIDPARVRTRPSKGDDGSSGAAD